MPSWTMRLPERSSGSTSPRFSRHRRSRAASSSPMMIRASEPPMNSRLSTYLRSAGIFPVICVAPVMEISLVLG